MFNTYYQTSIQKDYTNLYSHMQCIRVLWPILHLIYYAKGKMLSVIFSLLNYYYKTIFFHDLIHLNSFYEFPVYVLSQLPHAP